jgi:hypothetical protein
MAFFTRQYEVFAILGDPADEPVWTEARWNRIAPILDPLVQSARGPAAVRSTQLRAGSGSPNQRAISFGRIGWSAQGHNKWVHAANPNDLADSRPFFISAEVWAPSPKTCEREGQSPDVYVAVRNEQSVPGQVVTFNPIFLIAAVLGLATPAQPVAEAVALLLHSLVRVRCVRPWAFRFGDSGFTSAIGDLCVTGLLKLGPRSHRPPSAEMLEGAWEAF